MCACFELLRFAVKCARPGPCCFALAWRVQELPSILLATAKLVKTGSGGGKHFQPRDDAVQASILAVAEGVRAGAAISTPSVRFNVL